MKDKSRCQVNSYKKQGCIFIGKESDGILCRVPHNASLKDIKDILQRRKGLADNGDTSFDLVQRIAHES